MNDKYNYSEFKYLVLFRSFSGSVKVHTFEISRASHVAKIENTHVPKLEQLYGLKTLIISDEDN